MHSSTPARSGHGDRRGAALLAGIALLTLASLSMLALLSSSLDRTRATSFEVDERLAEGAAESVSALAIQALWSPLQVANPDSPITLGEARARLTDLGLLDQGTAANPATTDLSALLGLPDHPDGGLRFGDVQVESVQAWRSDDPDGTVLTLTSTVRRRPARGGDSWLDVRRSFQEVVRIDAAEWNGLDYAMLANNINCILCHLDVDSSERFYNRDPERAFPRVRVGSLESLMLRRDADSRIAGTLYLGGEAFHNNGIPITSWVDSTLLSAEFDADGNLLEDAWGDLVDDALDPADLDDPAALANLYLNYLADPEKQVDGELPLEFPAVFPDDGGVDPATGLRDLGGAGNRSVDAFEFFDATRDADGTISGGHVHVSDGGQLAADDLAAIYAAPPGAGLGGQTEGDVILFGTEDDPILLNGDVAIHGDLILHGVVKGEGSLRVSGNVYIPTDLVYADGAQDGERTFGVSGDGQTNALAIASGGNVVVGNLYHARYGRGTVTGDTDGSFSFIIDEMSVFNRLEWMKTQEFLPGPDDDNLDPSTYSVPNLGFEGPDYLARYYRFNEDGAVPIYNAEGYFDAATSTWMAPEHPGSWAPSKLTYPDPDDPADPVFYNADGTPRAVLSTLAPTDWISEDALRSLMRERLGERDARTAFEIDATLYSNNSIFGIIPRAGRGVGTNGRMLVNGAMVAADLGLLSPTHLQMNYDRRGRSLLSIRSSREVSIHRILRTPTATP